MPITSESLGRGKDPALVFCLLSDSNGDQIWDSWYEDERIRFSLDPCGGSYCAAQELCPELPKIDREQSGWLKVTLRNQRNRCPAFLVQTCRKERRKVPESPPFAEFSKKYSKTRGSHLQKSNLNLMKWWRRMNNVPKDDTTEGGERWVHVPERPSSFFSFHSDCCSKVTSIPSGETGDPVSAFWTLELWASWHAHPAFMWVQLK